MVSLAKVLLGFFGLAVVVVLIAVPTALYVNEKEQKQMRTFTLEDVFNDSMRLKSYSMRWISDHEYLHMPNDSVYLYDVISGQSSEYLSFTTFDEKSAYDYQLSADRRYVAFMSNYTKVWRHSFKATYSLYDRNTACSSASPLKPFRGVADEKIFNFLPLTGIPDEVQYFAWAPQTNKLAYVWRNNVYLKTTPESQPEQLTFSGKENEIFNGIPDWVYEEEMFSSPQACWWSPGGKYLAYAVFNDTEVYHIEYSWYGDSQYPSTVSIPYPKAGTPNPVVRLFVVDTNNKTTVAEVAVPASFSSGKDYLATVTWVTDECLAVQWLKRLQTKAMIQIYNLKGSEWVPGESLTVESRDGWIGRFSPPEPVFTPNNSSYYLLMSDTKGYKHIHHVVQGVATAITTGKWEVVNILKVTGDSIYYSSTEKDLKPGGRNVYKWTKVGTKCLTCAQNAESCQYNSAYFSHDASFYQMSCRGPGIPYQSLMDNRKDTEVRRLEDNGHFRDLIADIQMPTMRRDTLDIAGYKLWYQMFLPPGFDKSKKYPLLIDVYAGPCSQKVDFTYRVGWSTYLASTEKIIVASFDGRGSCYQGDKIMHEIYKRLGTYEVEDQITAARKFIDMGFIDKHRVAIWGWSYGGYVSSMALGFRETVFKFGIAVAPVSKWKYYDSIYTERYMTEPKDNLAAYMNSTVTERAKNFHSVKYLLVHGTADDNVHFQSGAEISEALVEEQVDFEAMWYTDKDHSLAGAANKHVYTHMTHFLKRCLK